MKRTIMFPLSPVLQRPIGPVPPFPPPFNPLPPLPHFNEPFRFPPYIPDFVRWVIKPVVKILIVVDGGIVVNSTISDFGIGKVIDIIENNPFYDWVDFEITCAERGGNTNINHNATSHEFTYSGFTFNMGGFNINDYNQIWFFGINPVMGGDDRIADIGNTPLNNPIELEILMQWMDTQQGGVLAMGDHDVLGASLCNWIPRVRNMRKWLRSDGVPLGSGNTRKDTNQPKSTHIGAGSLGADSGQRDDLPQPIDVLLKEGYGGFLRVNKVPHPILCGVDGIIDVLPDHAHEGQTLGNRWDGGGSFSAPVDTSSSSQLTFGSYSAYEYPNSIDGSLKQEPQIIALGKPINTPLHSKNNDRSANPTGLNDSTPFGLVSVYDGERANIGRVVVDSTWHHWFDLNINGIEAAASPANFNKIQNYFVNIAVWLSNQSLRNKMSTAAIWNGLVLHYDPMAFDPNASIWTYGLKAYDVLGNRASQCLITEWVRLRFDEIWLERVPIWEGPCLTCPPFEVFEAAIFGGIIKEMLPLVETYRQSDFKERVVLSEKLIGESMFRGIGNGINLLKQDLSKSLEFTARQIKELTLMKVRDKVEDFIVENKSFQLSFELNGVLLNNPIFNLMQKNENPFFSVKLTSNGIDVKGSPFFIRDDKKSKLKRIDKASTALYFDAQTFFFSGIVNKGENFYVELFLHANEKDGNPTRIWDIFFSGDPEKWVGNHKPDFNSILNGSEAVGVWLNVINN